jgi:hypothetical protein
MVLVVCVGIIKESEGGRWLKLAKKQIKKEKKIALHLAYSHTNTALDLRARIQETALIRIRACIWAYLYGCFIH